MCMNKVAFTPNLTPCRSISINFKWDPLWYSCDGRLWLICRRLLPQTVWHLKLRPLISPLGNLTPVQHSELQDMTCQNNAQLPHNPACFRCSVRFVMNAAWGCYCQPCIHFCEKWGSRRVHVIQAPQSVKAKPRGQGGFTGSDPGHPVSGFI